MRILLSTMSRKFHGLHAEIFSNSTADHCFYNSIMTAETYSWIQEREIVFHFSKNVAKTYSNGLKISRSNEVKYLFHFNSFILDAPFLYPLKTSKILTVFWCFRRIEKGCIGNKWVKTYFDVLGTFHTSWTISLNLM